MRAILSKPIDQSSPDFTVVKAIEKELLREAGGLAKLKQVLPGLIRQAIDEVIDTPRTGRVYARELEKTEKTYIGTKVEILVRRHFNLPKGILDLRIAGYDVDVKNTLGQTWMIPREAIGKPCILVASDEKKQLCYFGIFVAHLHNLTNGLNQDQKRSVSAAGASTIHWLLVNEPFPTSFWAGLGAPKTQAIMRGSTGNDRVAALFRQVQRQIVDRDILQAVAQQKDYMKRLRKNGGARDQLADEGIAVLSGKYDSALIKKLGLPFATGDEFVSLQAGTDEEWRILQTAGHLPPKPTTLDIELDGI
jgi:hypothetical protein